MRGRLTAVMSILFVSCRLKAHNIMESCLSYIYPHTRVRSIVGILKTTAHNAYPVVTIDKAVSTMAEDDDYAGNPSSTNDDYARSKTLSFVVSEQRLRSQSVEDSRHDRGEVILRQASGSLDECGSMMASSMLATSFMNARLGFDESGKQQNESNFMFTGRLMVDWVTSGAAELRLPPFLP